MIITAITFLVILTILVLIHELGHFSVAKLIGVKVEEFGLGLPPKIWGKKVGKTIYSLNWLPIGGFVRLAGEDDDESQKTKVKGSKLHEYFWARSKKERSAILVAGVCMNFVLAVTITAVLLVAGVREASGRVHIERVLPDSPAKQAGLEVNDIVAAIQYDIVNDDRFMQKLVVTPQDLIDVVKENAGEKVDFVVVRNGDMMRKTVVPRKAYPVGEGPTGIAISDLELHKYPWSQAPGKALMINITRGRDMLVSLGDTVWKLVTFQKLQADVAGPIGIAQVTGQAVKFGWAAVLEFASILSLNLAVLNILPIPALDGGRLMFVFLEKALGKRIRPAFEKSTHQVGMIILLGLILLVSINDILRLVRGG